jgi:hypothetical protein
MSEDHRCILGGPTLVRDIPGAVRIAGADRYATNQALRDTLAFNTEHIYVANGLTLVDALTGSALAAKSGAAIMLTPTNANTDLVSQFQTIYMFGGER